MVKLSVVIITFNEEQNIGRCLASITGIADEVVVVDSGSTDRTEEICENAGAKFYKHPFEGYIQQKNYALGLTTCDYVLSLDADEALSPELRESIFRVKNNWTSDAYSFNRLTNYCGKWIYHCGWYPDVKLRLFKKGMGKWGGTNPHDKFILSDEKRPRKLKGDLFHYSYYTIREHLQQVNNFTEIDSAALYESGKRTSLLMIALNPPIRFIRDYFFRLGILDGYYGYVICRISSHATFIKYVKLFQLQKNKGN